jgi:hypothetical protein
LEYSVKSELLGRFDSPDCSGNPLQQTRYELASEIEAKSRKDVSAKTKSLAPKIISWIKTKIKKPPV